MIESISIFSSPAENAIFFIATGFYVLFLAYVIVARVTAKPGYYSHFFKKHYQFGFLYLIIASTCIASQYRLSMENLISILIGLFLFFLYQYGLVFLIINVMKKSVSLNLLVSLYKAGGSSPISQLSESHLDGRGIKYVTEDRIDQLIATQCIKSQGNSYFVTEKGLFILKLTNFFLNIFSLKRFL